MSVSISASDNIFVEVLGKKVLSKKSQASRHFLRYRVMCLLWWQVVIHAAYWGFFPKENGVDTISFIFDVFADRV